MCADFAASYIVDRWVRGADFYGREALISEILEGARDGIWLLGTRQVGKTSLLKVLRGGEIDPREEQTHGILIDELSLPHLERDGIEMKLACWDFGGQEIYRATH